MTPTASLRYVSLFVPDLEEAARTYEALLGTPPAAGPCPAPANHPFAAAGPVVFELGSVALALYQVDGKTWLPIGCDGSRDGGLGHRSARRLRYRQVGGWKGEQTPATHCRPRSHRASPQALPFAAGAVQMPLPPSGATEQYAGPRQTIPPGSLLQDSPVLTSVISWQLPETHKSLCLPSHWSVLAHAAPAPSRAAQAPFAQYRPLWQGWAVSQF
jgi:hypothetical protein